MSRKVVSKKSGAAQISPWQKWYIAPVLLIVAVCLANVLYLAHVFNPNPLLTRSNLPTKTTPGLIAYGGHTIDPNDGYTTQALGRQAVHDIIHGQMPWWNYNEQVGAPLAGEMQSAALFPLTLLIGLDNGVLIFHIVLEIMAALATYYFLRKLQINKAVSFLVGLAFGLSSVFAWFGNAIVNPVAFLPLLLLGIEIALDKAEKGEKGGWLLVAVALALSLYAGFPEVAYLDGLFVLGWAIMRFFTRPTPVRKDFAKKLVSGLVIGLMLAAPIIIAFADYLPYAESGIHKGASTASLSHIGLPAFVMPYIYGPIFGFHTYDSTSQLVGWWGSVGGYISVLLIFLACLGLFAPKYRARALKVFLVLWILITVARIYGLLDIAKILNYIPGIRVTAVYRYLQATTNMAILILAALGLDYVFSHAKRKIVLPKRQVLIVFTFCVVCILALLPIAQYEHHNLLSAPHNREWFMFSIEWALFSIGALAFTLLFLKKYQRVIIPILLLIDVVGMFIIPQLSAPRSAQIDTKPVSFLQENLGNYRFYSIGSIMPNYSSFYNIASINTNNLPISKNWNEYVLNNLSTNVEPIVFTGVNQKDPSGQTPLEAFLINPAAYEYVGVKYVVTYVGALDTEKAQSIGIHKVWSDKGADIYELPSPEPYFTVTSGSCQLKVKSKSALTANCSTPSTLLRRELYMPGWTATVNGHRVSVAKAGPLFQTISLPKGNSTIDFQFSPPHIDLAFASFFLALGIVLIDFSLLALEKLRGIGQLI